jgi:hypothetical protein
MSLFETIKADQRAARLAKPRDEARVNALTSLITEAAKIGDALIPRRDPTDEEVLGRLRAAIKNAGEILKHAQPDSGIYTATEQEVAVLESYLPKQMSEDEIRTAIASIISQADKPNIGVIMKRFKENHAGLYDGATVQKLAKEALS